MMKLVAMTLLALLAFTGGAQAVAQPYYDGEITHEANTVYGSTKCSPPPYDGNVFCTELGGTWVTIYTTSQAPVLTFAGTVDTTLATVCHVATSCYAKADITTVWFMSSAGRAGLP